MPFLGRKPLFPLSNISLTKTKCSHLAYLERLTKSQAKDGQLTPNLFCPSLLKGRETGEDFFWGELCGVLSDWMGYKCVLYEPKVWRINLRYSGLGLEKSSVF